MNPRTKTNQSGDERVLFSFLTYSPSWREIRAGSPGRNHEAGREVDTMDKHCSLTSFPRYASSILTNQGPLAPGFINHLLRKCPTNMLTGQSGGDSSTEVPLPSDSSLCWVNTASTSALHEYRLTTLEAYFDSSSHTSLLQSLPENLENSFTGSCSCWWTCWGTKLVGFRY